MMVLASLHWAAVLSLTNTGIASATEPAAHAGPTPPATPANIIRLAMFFGIIVLLLVVAYLYETHKGAK